VCWLAVLDGSDFAQVRRLESIFVPSHVSVFLVPESLSQSYRWLEWHHRFVDGLDLEVAHHCGHGVVRSLQWLVSRDSPLGLVPARTICPVMSSGHVLR